MITIGIISVFDKELSEIKSKMEMVTGKNIVGNDFFIGKMYSKNLVLVRPKIGKVNSAITSQVLIDLYGVDYIIEIGSAIPTKNNLNTGDLVISSEFIYHDIDATVFGNDAGIIPELNDFNKTHFTADEVLIKCAENKAIEFSSQNNIKVYTGRVATGDQFIYDEDVKSQIDEIFSPYCIDMEGTAIAHTCYLNKIPFVSINSIASSKNSLDYDKYIYETLNGINKIVMKMVEEL